MSALHAVIAGEDVDRAPLRYRFELAMRLGDLIDPAEFVNAWDFVELSHNLLRIEDDGSTLRPRFRCEYDAADPVEAIARAVADIRTGFSKAVLVAVAPDWVALPDAARLVNVAEKTMSALRRDHATFPKPTNRGYRLAPLLRWLDSGGYARAPAALTGIAEAAMAMNTAMALAAPPRTD